ncbi:MAG: hypothetical protein MUE51_12585, partial [Thermoleophilia bacterium]|nr:hypothetical protein [Thermoleophilia bacterium]
MTTGIAQVLTYAVGVAISPVPIIAVVLMLVPIIAVVLMLFSAGARRTGPAFVAGWMVALAAVGGAAYALADGAGVATDAGAAEGASWPRIAAGVGFLPTVHDGAVMTVDSL